jgi:hypothetical protein
LRSKSPPLIMISRDTLTRSCGTTFIIKLTRYSRFNQILFLKIINSGKNDYAVITQEVIIA